ncbi:MAG: monooxygenase, partial [Peptostreptococcaceae bacterium]|nr:monooxygenase [Peptostreptococcaceae bacterium]
NIYEDYEISSIKGEGRISEVTLSKDGNNLEVGCDTLIFAQPMLSDGVVAMRSNIILNPETTGAKVNKNYMTSRENIYACGNGIFIHNSIEEIEKECISLINNLK